MSSYIIVFVIAAFIYFVQIRNKPAPKTDWETLPLLDEYKTMNNSKNEQNVVMCRHCGSTEIIKKPFNSEKENPNKTKHYYACTKCKVILWRSETIYHG